MIQSFSDIITNSSSEVFVISTNKHAEVAEFLNNVCDLFGVDMDEIMYYNSATHNEVVGYNLKCKKGDLVIRSTYDNSIPGTIMNIIEDLDYCPKGEELGIREVNREHLG
jgi:hypothetical protein